MGDPAVGKSALTQMFQSGGQRFPKAYNMTCGVEFCVKTTNVAGTDEAVELHLFDTAGQDVFAEIMPLYWEGAKVRTPLIVDSSLRAPNFSHTCHSLRCDSRRAWCWCMT